MANAPTGGLTAGPPAAGVCSFRFITTGSISPTATPGAIGERLVRPWESDGDGTTPELDEPD
jgi:hypothetical protein